MGKDRGVFGKGIQERLNEDMQKGLVSTRAGQYQPSYVDNCE